MAMDGLMQLIHNYKVIDIFIGAMGLAAFGIILERAKALYFDLSTPAAFYKDVMLLMTSRDVAKASALCATQKNRPLAEMLKRLIDNSHLNPGEVEKTYRAAMSDLLPKLAQRLGYLSMVANVVTMVGLLGTVMGLIVSFQAVAQADPSQKQTLLAAGISMAMHATALGLLIAIPVMIAYSFLAEKQNHIIGQLESCGQDLLEFLRSQDRIEWNMENVYPINRSTQTEKGKAGGPPPANIRAA